MASRTQLRQAFIEAQGALRLEGMPIVDRDDDIYSPAIDESLYGPLRDLVLMPIRAELEPAQ